MKTFPMPKKNTVTVELPAIGTGEPAGYVARNVDLPLTAEQAETARHLLDRLVADGARLKDGTPVNETRHALGYVLEQYRAAK